MKTPQNKGDELAARIEAVSASVASDGLQGISIRLNAALAEYRTPWTLADHMRRFFLKWIEATMPLHRQDFTEDMLPDGWRPLLLGELEQDNDYYLAYEKWHKGPSTRGEMGAGESDLHRRTTRPLPAVAKPILTPAQIAEGWVEWRGGECPVWGGSKPKVMIQSGTISDGSVIASAWSWDVRDGCGAIIAYLPDPYEALKKAHSEGRVIEENVAGTFRCGTARPDYWLTKTDSDWSMPPERYRVAPVAEKWAAEKAAFAAGKVIQWKYPFIPDWITCTQKTPPLWFNSLEYRVAPSPVLVALGPDDVTPGSAIRYRLAHAKEDYWMIFSVDCEGMHVQTPRGCECVEYSRAQYEMEISRDGGKTWHPCSKPADAKEGK